MSLTFHKCSTAWISVWRDHKSVTLFWTMELPHVKVLDIHNNNFRDIKFSVYVIYPWLAYEQIVFNVPEMVPQF